MPPHEYPTSCADPEHRSHACRARAILRRCAVLMAATLVLRGVPAVGQERPSYHVSWGDGLSIGSAGVVYLLPRALGLPKGGPSCAPCDPATLPGVDRLAVHSGSAAANIGSDVALATVAGFSAYAVFRGLPPPQRRGNAVVLASALGWTAASAEWLKVIVRRKRPVLYTPDALAAADDRESQKSLPSGHSSIAFAAATCYLVIANREHLAHRVRNSILLYAGAVGVSALRVAAGKHFPTDVLASAGLGIGIGWLVPTIHR